MITDYAFECVQFYFDASLFQFLLMVLDYECHNKITKQVMETKNPAESRRRDSIAEAPSLVTRATTYDESNESSSEASDSNITSAPEDEHSKKNDLQHGMGGIAGPIQDSEEIESKNTIRVDSGYITSRGSLEKKSATSTPYRDESIEFDQKRIDFDNDIESEMFEEDQHSDNSNSDYSDSEYMSEMLDDVKHSDEESDVAGLLVARQNSGSPEKLSGPESRQDGEHVRHPTSQSHAGAPMKPKGRCTIAVVAAGLVEQEESKSFVMYRIRVTDGYSTWFVLRRYRNFETLHRVMRDVPGYKYKLPPKRILFHQLNGRFVESRKSLLERFLSQILRDDVIAESDEIWRFLSMREYETDKSSQANGMLSSVSRRIRQPMDVITRHGSMAVRRATRTISNSNRQASFQKSLSKLQDGLDRGDSFRNRNRSQDGSSAVVQGKSSRHTRGTSADAILAQWDQEFQDQDSTLSRAESSLSQIESSSDVSYAEYDVHPLSLSCSDLRESEEFEGDNESTKNSESVGTAKAELKLTNDLRGLGLNVVNLVDIIFQFRSRGWLKRQVLGVARQVLQMVLGNTIDTFIAARLGELCRGETVAKWIQYLQNEILWPDSIWFENHPNKMTDEQWMEYGRFASSCVHLLLVDCAPSSLVNLIGKSQFRRCMNDVYYVVQSKVFMRQLGNQVLDLLVTAWFPELDPIVNRNLNV